MFNYRHELNKDSQLYLIQRANIRTPLAEKDTRLSQAVEFDYMGAAEFEFGALPASFRRFDANKANWSTRLIPEIVEDEHQLRVFSYMTDEEFEHYKKLLIELRNDPGYTVRLKERSEFALREREVRVKLTPTGRVAKNQGWQPKRADFWWDITYDAMFGFRKEFMNRLPDYVEASIVVLNQQKK